ncbi:MAG: hypothetical protein ABL916_23440 [Burkholderiaceae bacterium]
MRTTLDWLMPSASAAAVLAPGFFYQPALEPFEPLAEGVRQSLVGWQHGGWKRRLPRRTPAPQNRNTENERET